MSVSTPHATLPSLFLYQHDSCGCCRVRHFVLFACLQTGGAVDYDWECSRYPEIMLLSVRPTLSQDDLPKFTLSEMLTSHYISRGDKHA